MGRALAGAVLDTRPRAQAIEGGQHTRYSGSGYRSGETQGTGGDIQHKPGGEGRQQQGPQPHTGRQ